MAEEEKITVRVDGLTYSEYGRAVKAVFYKIYAVALLVFSALLAAFFLTVGKESIYDGVSLSSLVVPILTVVGVLVIFEFFTRKNYKRSGFGNLSLQYTFTGAGWRVETGGQSQSCKWSNTKKIRENDKVLLLYPSSKSVNIVPKRCMSGSEMAKIRDLFEVAYKKPEKIKK